MAQGLFLPELFDALDSVVNHTSMALYGPCDYWQLWYQSLRPDNQSRVTPYHYPLYNPISYEHLYCFGYRTIISSQKFIFKAPPVISDNEQNAAWCYYPSEQKIYISFWRYPMALLSLEDWLFLYQLAPFIAQTVFQDKSYQVVIESLDTGSKSRDSFVTLTSMLIQSDIKTHIPTIVLMESLSFDRLFRQAQHSIPEASASNSFFSWRGRFSGQIIMPPIYGIAKKKTILACVSLLNASVLQSLIAWVVAANDYNVIRR
jgi:hypothetical protein